VLNELIIAIDEMNESIIQESMLVKFRKVITRIILKTNTVLQMRDVGVEFKTI